MEAFVPQCVQHLRAHPASDVEATLRALPTLLSSPSSPSPVLTPKAFFVAFHGTLTLAFEGWPRCVRERKVRIDAELCAQPRKLITDENPGTRWPKVTLGVLDDGVILREGEARKVLRTISALNEELLQKCDAEEHLNAFDVVLFDKRSQESRLASCRINWDECNENTKDELDLESVQFVEKVLAEPNDFEEYFPHINNVSRRKAFYNEPCTPEISIVHFLTSAEILEIIRKFRSRIDEEFPNLYSWMADKDLHASVRAVNFVNKSV